MSVPGFTPIRDRNSPFFKTEVYSTFMGYYIHRDIPPADTDTTILLDNARYDQRPDLLAYDLYGTPDLWWIFGVRNGLEDLVHDIREGMVLAVPDRNRIMDLL